MTPKTNDKPSQFKKPTVAFFSAKEVDDKGNPVPNSILRAFRKMKPEWEFLDTIENPTKLFEHPRQEDVDVAVASEMYLTSSTPMGKKYRTKMERTIVQVAPSRLFIIIVKDLKNRQDFVKKIKDSLREQAALLRREADFDVDDVCFIDAKQFSFDTGVSHIASRVNYDNKETVENLLGHEVELDDEEDYDDVYEEDEYDNFDPFDVNFEGMDEDTGHNAKVILSAAPKGGVGKSTTSLTVASYLSIYSRIAAQMGAVDKPLKVLVMDFDISNSQLAFATNVLATNRNLKTMYTLYDEHGYDGDLSTKNLKECLYYNKSLNCDVMFASMQPITGYDIPLSFYSELIARLRKMYDYIILDTGIEYLEPVHSHLTYKIADEILLVTDTVIMSLYSIPRWKTYVVSDKRGPQVDPSKIHLVVTKFLGDKAGANRADTPPKTIQSVVSPIQVASVVPSMQSSVGSAFNSYNMGALMRNYGFASATSHIVNAITHGEVNFPPLEQMHEKLLQNDEAALRARKK